MNRNLLFEASFLPLLVASIALSGCGSKETPARTQAPAASRKAKSSPEPQTWDSSTLPGRGRYAGSKSCEECHQAKYDAWQRDWHSRALSPATPEFAVGDFHNRRFAGHSSEAMMYSRGAKLLMKTRDAAGKNGEFPITWLIGGKRMQDTVTVFPDGRWQVLPVYFHVTGKGEWVDYNEFKQGAVGPGHPYYWTNFRRTANKECLDCHSTGLDVRYDRETHRWTTEFADSGVACESCHGPGARHSETKAKGDIVRADHLSAAHQLSVCARGHGPREPLYPTLDPDHRFVPGRLYGDYYQPLVIVDGLDRSGEFFADGRPSSSSFEYQALLESRCYRFGKGVTCITCHTAPHEDHAFDEIKIRKGASASANADASCVDCHRDIAAQGARHSHHTDPAAQSCISCHMPRMIPGVLDEFADHTIDIPNPGNTVAHGVPNACNHCHTKAAPSAMAAAIKTWWPNSTRLARRTRLADAIDEKTREASEPYLEQVISDLTEAPILRGAAAILLAQRFPSAALTLLPPRLHDSDPLVRARFIEALGYARAEGQAEAIAPFLEDESLHVRQIAALVLGSLGDSRGEAALRKLAGDPATTALVRPHILLAQIDARRGDLDGTKNELDAALAHAPYLSDALVMRADIDARRGDLTSAKKELEEAIRFDSSHAGAKKRLAVMKSSP